MPNHNYTRTLAGQLEMESLDGVTGVAEVEGFDTTTPLALGLLTGYEEVYR